jgi:YegS/Rv2252/BmrU family lipid kinase
MGKIAVLFNPSAGKGKALKKKEKLENLLRKYNIKFDLIITENEEDLKNQVIEKGENYNTIVGAGGDSTFHIIVNEIIRNKINVNFGMIGLGSSNDITKEFGIDSLEKACIALKSGRIRKIDLGCVTKAKEVLRYFIGQANIGLGVFVNKYVEEFSKKNPFLGKNQTLAGGLGILNSYFFKKIPIPLTISTDGRKIQGDFLLAVFSNIRYWATGKKVNPHAISDDGKIDCCFIKYCDLPRFLKIIVSAQKGKHIKAKEVTILQSPYFEVSSEIPFEIQTDGEIMGGHSNPLKFDNISISILPQAISIIC